MNRFNFRTVSIIAIAISNKYSSNPHSPVETIQRQRLRPRGFLPWVLSDACPWRRCNPQAFTRWQASDNP